MFGDIIVGVDGSPGGRDAIALANMLVVPDANVTLAYVVGVPPSEPWTSAPPYAAFGQAVHLQRERAEAMLRAARAEAGVALARGEVSQHCVWSSSVGRGLHELAESQRADLLVLGSSRRGPLGRVLVGDHTRAALTGAPCAVAVAPTGYSDRVRDIRRIGVGYGATPESEHALDVARRLAGAHHAQLSACTAVTVPLPAIGPGPSPLTEVIEPLLKKARQRIAAHAGVAPEAGYGPPFEVLVNYSGSVDLLVVGSRGYGPGGRLVHGSTSTALARAARCALLVLPRSARDAAAGAGSTEGRATVGAARR